MTKYGHLADLTKYGHTMQDSQISWTTKTWNPTHGCSKVSSGCANCYAETLSQRYGHTPKPWTRRNEADNVLLKPHKLREPLRKSVKDGTRIFVNSMSDLFHRRIPDSYRDAVFAVMAQRPGVVFQVLTKRSDVMSAYTRGLTTDRLVSAADAFGLPKPRVKTLPLENVWLGVSIENQEAVERLSGLRTSDANIRFVSAEPLIGPVEANFSAIDWLIVGGESGPGWRAMDQAWARSLRDQCLRDDVAYFYKQDSGYKNELRPWLVEEDGSRWQWHQFPGDLSDPVSITAA